MKKQLLTLLLITITFNIVAQTHRIEIHANNRVASLLMSPTEYNNWKIKTLPNTAPGQFNDSAIREALFKDIYKKFDDKFDFIFLILNEDVIPNKLPYGQLIQVSNDVSGIGIGGVYNNSSDYGSAGKLKAVMHLPQRNFLRSGPSLHELMHNWGNFGIPTESPRAPGVNPKTDPYRPHWGFTGGSTPGQLGGFKQSSLVENGGNSYTVDDFGPGANGANSVPYNEIELYLMGMIKISDVSNFDVFSNFTSSTINNVNKTINFTASNRTTYTPASLEALLGTRVPAYTASQKDFKLLIVVLTDAPLTTSQWQTVDEGSEKFGRSSSDGEDHIYNFWEATNGLGTMETGNLRSSTLGINENILNEENISIYPNTASDYIQIAGLKKPKNYIIYDVLGRETLSGTINENEKIDIKGFKSGLYFITIGTDKKMKFLKK